MKSGEFVKQAHLLKSMGFSVIPLYGHNDESVDVKIRGKRPIPKGWEEFCNRQATDKEIEDWSKAKPELNIGIACGRASNLTVVDADSDAAITYLNEKGIPDTLRVKTRKGYHFYFKYCENPNVNNRVRILEDIDIRTSGGQVVAVGSTHQTGFVYEWANLGTEIAEFPKWLEEVFDEAAKQKSEGKSETVAPTEVHTGSRNATLISMAGSIYKATRSKEAMESAVRVINSQFPEPLPDSEVDTIIKSASGYQLPNKLYRLTDAGMAERFIDKYGKTVCYNVDSGNWMIYDGRRWKEIPTDSKTMTCAELMDMYIGMIRLVPNDVPEDDDNRDTYEEIAKKYENFGWERKVMSKASGLLGKSINAFDVDDYMLNCKNVTLDLNNHKVLEHKPEHLLSTMIPVMYNPEATCPLWDGFMERIMGGNKDLIRYLQKAVGYSLTGSTEEQVFFTLYGSGANGKSVFLDLIAHLLGDYGHQAAFSTFLTKATDSGGNARSDIASMKRARLVVASESGVAKTLDDAIIKDITGGKKISARFLYKNDFTFMPKMKIWLTTNHKPNIRDDSNGMWRRVKLIPFGVTIPTAEQDKTLYFKLLGELSGILNWALEGLKMWQEEGLGSCKIVDDEVEDYKKDMDDTGRFIEDCLDVSDKDAVEQSSLIYDKYVQWCKSNGLSDREILNNKWLSIKLMDKGYKKAHKKNGTVWYGIKVLTEF